MTNQGTTDDLYFEWLYGFIGSVSNRNPNRSAWTLAKQLFTKKFVSFIPNDENRIEDGMALRLEFVEQFGLYDIDLSWMELDCSVLEMLIALSRRAAFQSSKSDYEWFWTMMQNLGLDKYRDSSHTNPNDEWVDGVLECVVSRIYSHTGEGGLFPLKNPKKDQRGLEIWGQLSAYLLETEYPELDI